MSEIKQESFEQSIPSIDAIKHVKGESVFTNDIPHTKDCLFAAVGWSEKAHAIIKSIDLSEVIKDPNVKAIVTANDVPGLNDCGVVLKGDPILIKEKEAASYLGQPLFGLAATSRKAALKAVRKAKIKYKTLKPIVTIKKALKKKSFIDKPTTIIKGEPLKKINEAKHKLKGTFSSGSQDHFYLEPQSCFVVPKEDNDLLVYASTQNPSKTQSIIAHMLKQKINSINVICQRLGGGFGGKETSFLGSCITALLAHKTKKPVKLFFDRTDNMIVFGKRHPFESSWEVGFNEMGLMEGLKISIASNAGISADLSNAIQLRCQLHLDNCYFLENILIKSHICKTNISSSTAFRGFGGPQGVLIIENIIDDIARYLKKDPAEIRKRNFYQTSGRKNITHYGQKLEDAHIIHDLHDELMKSSNYKARKNNIKKFNSKSKYYKRGITFNFCKFGISFTTKFLNTGGAQVNFYLDGSVHINSQQCEMGNSSSTKVSQVAAHQLGLPVNKIKISPANTYKVSNTPPSAASSTTDLSAMATVNAISNVKQKISAYVKSKYKLRGDIKGVYKNEKVKFKGLKEFKFKDLLQEAHLNRVQLFSSGFYKVPKINFDKKKFKGSPFYYFTWGACVSEVEVDVLTGETKILRVDAIIDAGKPINKNLELGQAAGGLTQAFGWALHEEVIWDSKGKLLTDTLSTYKVPSISDKPEIFNVELYKKGKNKANSINLAKTLGEPPFVLGANILFAVKDAVHACSNYTVTPKLDLPATPEKVLMAIEKVRKQ